MTRSESLQRMNLPREVEPIFTRSITVIISEHQNAPLPSGCLQSGGLKRRLNELAIIFRI